MANTTCRKCHRAADAGPYRSPHAADIMARALNPFFCGHRKKSVGPELAQDL